MSTLFGVLTQSLNNSIRQCNIITPSYGLKGYSETHFFINNRAIQILFSDGHYHCAEILKKFHLQLDEGSIWVDKGIGSASHHYNPITGTGLWMWPNAYKKCNDYIQEAGLFWLNAKFDKSIFLLGAAAHLVQDLCVPHHATCNMFEGHLKYERWTKRHKERYSVIYGGSYDIGKTPGEWVSRNALFSMPYLNMVTPGTPDTDFDNASEILLKRAQRTTAGFFLYFFNLVNKFKGDAL